MEQNKFTLFIGNCIKTLAPGLAARLIKYTAERRASHYAQMRKNNRSN